MRMKRFLSVFLLLTLLVTLWSIPVGAAENAAVVTDPDIQAKAALLVDEETGTVLYAKNEHQELYPASLTKIMTALLVLEAVDSGKLSLDQKVTATSSALAWTADDGSSAGIKVGETLSVQELLYCMLVVSANEACDILAETVGGSVDAFVDAMNAKAKELGCKNTHFANPSGLNDSQHYTSAWDLYLITKEALTHKEFMTICDTADVVIPATNLSPERHLYTTNYLLSNWRAVGYRYTDAHGIKTGSTDEAGHCLVSSATKGGRTLLSVVLGAQRIVTNGVADVQSFSETKRLFEWGFDTFTTKTALSSLDMLASVPVSLSKTDSVAIHPAQDVELLLPKNLDPKDLEQTIKLNSDTAEAPVTAGEELGQVTLSYDGKVYATVPLVALNDVEASRMLTILHNIKQFFEKTIVRVILGILVGLAAALVIWKLTLSRRRYRYGRPTRHRNSYHGRRR